MSEPQLTIYFLMARPPSITDEELLRHARAVFLDHGIRATAVDVAHRAGVSEALVFKRFGTKDELFRKSMQAELSPDEIGWLADLDARIGRGDLRTHLFEIGMAAVRFFRKLMPLIMMSWSNTRDAETPTVHARRDAPPFVARRRIEAFFEAERRLGRMREGCDTEIVARLFLGALFNHVSWEITIGAHDPRPLGAEAYVRGVIDLLWDGIAPPRPKKKG